MKKIHIYHIMTLCVFAIVISFIHQYPNYYALKNTPIGHMFTGQASWFDPWDINLYVSAIKQGQQGSLMYANTYSISSNKSGALIYQVYTLAGYLIRNIDPFLLFHIVAIVCSIFLVTTIYIISRKFIRKSLPLFISIWLTIAGGGLGWLVGVNNSADLSITSFTYHSAFQRPHEAIGISIYILSLFFLQRSIYLQSYLYLILSWVFITAMIPIYPYYFVSYVVIGVVYYLFTITKPKRIYILMSVALLGIESILLLYYRNHLSSNGFSNVVNQHLNLVNPISLILGYGLFLPTSIYFVLKSKLNTKNQFLLIWIVCSLLLSFLPIGIARFFLRGLFLPLSLLSVQCVSEFTKKKSYTFIIILFFILISSLSTLHIFSQRINSQNRDNIWFYKPIEFKSVVKLINTSNINNILTNYNLGNILPAYTNERVYFGHMIQSGNNNLKLNNINKFFNEEMATNDAKKFATNNDIQYVLQENADISNAQLSYDFLEPIYKDRYYTLYTLGRKKN